MTDLITRAEQWLFDYEDSLPYSDAEEMALLKGPELVRALVAELTNIHKNMALLKAMYDRKVAQVGMYRGINDAWPGDPGAAD